MAQFLGHEWAELDTPFAQRLMADHNAALVEQFLNISVTEGKPVVQPDGVLDDRHGKAVAVGRSFGHGGEPTPIQLRQHNRGQCCPSVFVARDSASAVQMKRQTGEGSDRLFQCQERLKGKMSRTEPKTLCLEVLNELIV